MTASGTAWRRFSSNVPSTDIQACGRVRAQSRHRHAVVVFAACRARATVVERRTTIVARRARVLRSPVAAGSRSHRRNQWKKKNALTLAPRNALARTAGCSGGGGGERPASRGPGQKPRGAEGAPRETRSAHPTREAPSDAAGSKKSSPGERANDHDVLRAAWAGPGGEERHRIGARCPSGCDDAGRTTAAVRPKHVERSARKCRRIKKKQSAAARRPGRRAATRSRSACEPRGQSAAGQPERLELERWTDGWNASSGGSGRRAVVPPIAATEPIEPSCGGALRSARPVAPSRGRLWKPHG